MSEAILEEVKGLKSLILKLMSENDRAISRWCRGDKEAAHFVGFKSVNSFKAWAEKWQVYPRIEDGLKMWDKNDLNKAADKAKQSVCK